MASIFPFRAVRPTRDKVSLVSTRPYGDYSQAEMAAQLTYNSLSFLHVLNPAYHDMQRTSNEIRFGKVKNKYIEFKQENILLQDDNPAFYIHKIVTPQHVFTGIIGATKVVDYKSGNIKRHEDIIDYRINWLKDYLKYASFNSEPVLMTYSETPDIKKWLFEQTQASPEFEFSTTKNDNHFLWKIDHSEAVATIQRLFENVGNLYIADGHHRSASAEKLFDEKVIDSDACQYFMSFLIADTTVRIYEFNRLIRSFCGHSAESLLELMSKDFSIEKVNNSTFQPTQKHEFGFYIAGECYQLKLKNHLLEFHSPIDKLDTQILYTKILKPLLGIEDLRHDDRIEYFSGNKPLSRLIAAVEEGQFAMAFTLYPPTIDDIKAIADAQLVMPPKSTYIEPKFRSGLVIYEL